MKNLFSITVIKIKLEVIPKLFKKNKCRQNSNTKRNTVLGGLLKKTFFTKIYISGFRLVPIM